MTEVNHHRCPRLFSHRRAPDEVATVNRVKGVGQRVTTDENASSLTNISSNALIQGNASCGGRRTVRAPVTALVTALASTDQMDG